LRFMASCTSLRFCFDCLRRLGILRYISVADILFGGWDLYLPKVDTWTPKIETFFFPSLFYRNERIMSLNFNSQTFWVYFFAVQVSTFEISI
jgi:hypothetical protein